MTNYNELRDGQEFYLVRDCLKKKIIDNAPPVEQNWRFYYDHGYAQAERDLKRPRGEWIRTGSLGNGNAQYECSNCRYGDEHAESQKVPYCWHCGADMRGGAE